MNAAMRIGVLSTCLLAGAAALGVDPPAPPQTVEQVCKLTVCRPATEIKLNMGQGRYYVIDQPMAPYTYDGVINVIANEPDEREYRAKWQEERDVSRVPEDEPAVFLEVSVADASEFEADLEIRGEERFGNKVLTVSSAAVPNGIAAICLAMRDEFGLIPHVYFDWAEGSPLMQFLRFILWGAGEVAPVTREILRRAESDRSRRPHVHVG
jgi:hypothetical protein